MVTSINNNGGIPNVSQISKTPDVSSKREAEQAEERRKKDEVSLSDEALSLSQAEATARETRKVLEENQGQTLSSAGKRVDQLL